MTAGLALCRAFLPVRFGGNRSWQIWLFEWKCNALKKHEFYNKETGGILVNKSELVGVVAEKVALTKKDTEKIVSAVLKALKSH